jgi:Aspartyl protease
VSDLADFLSTRGYLRVPLRRSLVGHFHTEGTLNGRPIEVLVDTGASCTVVAMAVVRELGLPSQWIDSGAGGAGGAFDQFRIEGADLQLDAFRPQLAGPIGLDFEHVNAPLRAQGSAEVDLILGTDVFDAHAAVIDSPSLSLFLQSIPAAFTRRTPPSHSL